CRFSGAASSRVMVPTFYVGATTDRGPAPLPEAGRARAWKRLVDGGAHGAAGVTPTREVAAQAAHRRVVVEVAQLTGPLAGEFACARELVARVDEVEGVLDRRGGEQPPRELRGDGRTPEALALLQARDERLGEGRVVEQPDAREPVALAGDRLLVDAGSPQGALEFAAREVAPRERPHRDALDVEQALTLRGVAQQRTALVEVGAPGVVPRRLLGGVCVIGI